MTPFDDFVYLVNSILLGEEPTIEDFILLIGTFVAFIAFILWCCFPIVPKESNPPAQYDTQYTKYKKTDSPYDEKMWNGVDSLGAYWKVIFFEPRLTCEETQTMAK